MYQQDDINRQFSMNNNQTLSAIITLIGSFIAVFYLYCNAVSNPSALDYVKDSFGAIFIMSAVVIMVSAFLAVISAVTGYGRRRDHVVSSLSDKVYPKVCGNGRDKCWGNYLVGVYCHLFWFFTFFCLLFSVYVAFKLPNCWERIAISIIGGISLIISLLVYFCNYCKYKFICCRAECYERHEKKDDDLDCEKFIQTMMSKYNICEIFKCIKEHCKKKAEE